MHEAMDCLHRSQQRACCKAEQMLTTLTIQNMMPVHRCPGSPGIARLEQVVLAELYIVMV